ncbi:hypothetical protein JCM10450v2_006634 [Rhodotorula kratochvilovae]
MGVAQVSQLWNAVYATEDVHLVKTISDDFVPVCLYNIAPLNSRLEEIARHPGPTSTSGPLPPPLEIWLREVALDTVRQAYGGISFVPVRPDGSSAATEIALDGEPPPTGKGKSDGVVSGDVLNVRNCGMNQREFDDGRKPLESAANAISAGPMSAAQAVASAAHTPAPQPQLESSYGATAAGAILTELNGVCASSKVFHYLMAEAPPDLLSANDPSVPGVTTPYLYLSSGAFPFILHCEDLDFPSLNTHLAGPEKLWYILPGREKAAATDAMFDLVLRGASARNVKRLCPQACVYPFKALSLSR